MIANIFQEYTLPKTVFLFKMISTLPVVEVLNGVYHLTLVYRCKALHFASTQWSALVYQFTALMMFPLSGSLIPVT